MDAVVGDDPIGRLRITYSAGPAPMGSGRGGGPPTLVVAYSAIAPAPSSTTVTTVPWTRNENGATAGLKTTSYAENVIALAHAAERGGTEAIFANTAGHLCEGTGSNVFYVVDGELRTPTLASGCLAGVTRALVIEWCDAREVDEPLADVTSTRARRSSSPRRATSRPSDAGTTSTSRPPARSPKACADTWRTREAGTSTRERTPMTTLDPDIAARLRHTAEGLVPVVVQQQGSGEVLMLAWVDDEALARTIDTGRATYWSRSRREYWAKGDTSGHVQWVKEIRLDCDGDTLLFTVDQVGAACHTGDHTCFDADIVHRVDG